MTAIVRQLSWFEMVTPDRVDMDAFLREYIGADAWRTPRRLWRRMHHSKAGILIAENRIPKLRKLQRGSVGITVVANAAQQGADSAVPNLQNITNAHSEVAPTPARQQYRYHTDGGMEFDGDAQGESTIVYAALTTQTDDANDHTDDWWPDQPETSIGLDYDIQFNSESATGGVVHYLADNTGTNRTTATWYVLDTVFQDSADATHDGGIGFNRTNGVAKTPDVGLDTLTVTVEIRATTSGAALTSHDYDLDCEGT